MSEAVEVSIDGIASGGAGVGRLPDGKAVFVHRTAPGERVRVRVTEEKKRWARGRLVEVLREAPERRPAPCPHYARCGGCTLEHLSYEAQLAWKGRIVADALERIGGLEIPPPRVRPSPDEFRYRSRITVTLRRLDEGRVVAGFHELERPDRIVDLGGDCLLPEPELASTWDGLRRAWGDGASRLPEGDEIRLTLRSVREGVMLLVEGGRGRGDPEALLDAVDGLVAVWRNRGDGGARFVAGRRDTTERFLDEVVAVRGAAFLQVNRRAGEAVQRAALERVAAGEGVHVVDAYAGAGVLGRLLARTGARVTAIELDREAAAVAREAAPGGMEVLEGRVEDRLPEALPADVVVVNPPRTGLHDRIPPVLLDALPARIVYVSCDPATLARDASRLAPGYELRDLEAFDLFPQTAHVECVAVFEAEAGAAGDASSGAGPGTAPEGAD